MADTNTNMYKETSSYESPLIKLLERYGERIRKLEDRVNELEEEKNSTNVKLS